MSANHQSLNGSESLLSSLRQRLEAKRALIANAQAAQSTALDDAQQVAENMAVDQPRPGTAGASMLQERLLQDDQLTLVDLVSFDHCQELVQMPLQVEQQVLQQFATNWSSQPLPSSARQQADQSNQLPQETIGLYVAPHPRISSCSLYKMEQRLSGARKLDAQRLVKQVQEQFPDAQQIVGTAAPIGHGGVWLDENGLMLYEPNPSKASKQRPWRRYDHSEDITSTSWLPAVLAPLHLLDSRGVSYRLDVELSKLEFEVHPYMTLEHQLAAKLLCSFREYHRRAALGLASFYSNKLAALEDGLLNAREKLFSVHEEVQEQGQDAEQLLAAVAAVAQAEREVAEVRQLREEEETHLLGAVEAMSQLWKQLCEVRKQQGGMRLTDLGFSVVQLPRDDATPMQADGLTRQQLDIALLVAEAEPVAGLPAYPSAFPLSQADAELTAFTLRRVESTVSSHALLRSELQERLALLQDRVSADPDDPEIKSLQQQLEVLGPVPRRLPMTHQQEMELWNRAEEEVAAGRSGVYRPPRLQPCLTVLPAPASGPRSAARLGSSSTDSATGATSTLRSRLGWSTTGEQQQHQSTSGSNLAATAAGSESGVAGLGTGQLLPVSQQGAVLHVKLSYYARLLVNNRVVGTSEAIAMRDDFTLEFRDVFSIRLLKWPDSMQLQLWEKGTFRDLQVAEFFLVVPGLAGAPHVDPSAKPYSWTSPNPVPHQKLLQAIAVLQPLGVLPAADIANWQALNQTAAANRQQASLAGQGDTGVEQQDQLPCPDTAGNNGSTAGNAAGAVKVKNLKSRSVAAVYPSGRLFVRCGWVSDTGVEAHVTPFESCSGAATAAAAGTLNSMLQTLALQPPHGPALSVGEDGMVQVSLQGGNQQQQFQGISGAHGSPTAKGHNTLGASTSSPNASPSKARGKGLGPHEMIGNPLAHIGDDVEVGPRLAPPVPHVKADRALHRAAVGGSKSHGRMASKWLAQQMLDPNDPRNAMLLELLRAREAAAHSGSMAAGASDIFRLDITNELSMAIDRAADQRAAFIKQRWQAGPLRSVSQGAGQGARPLGTVAPLSAKDTLELQDAYREALALVEAANMGLGAAGRQSAVALAAAMSGRQERALKWAQGALVKAIEIREAAMRAFALRVRASCNQLGSGRALGRKYKTDDVVKDAPLPEFKLDLSSMAAALAPARPLRPQRRAVKKLQACVPRDTQLVITLQRASNLPRRLASGGGVRQQSPNRTSGARMSNTSRFASRDRGMSSRDGLSGFRSPTRATREMPGGDWEQAEEFDGSRVGRGGESLSCFVEVKFRGKAQRTAAVDSNMPMWNEQLLFPVVGLDQEASPSALKESDGLITINVFDEVITPTAAAKAARNAARAGQTGGMESLSEGPALPERERRFLGCIRVPLAAVYQAEVIYGAFKLDVPPVLLGYVQDNGRPPSLSVYLTLKPRLAPPVEADEERVSGEQGEVARHARKWVAGTSSLSQCRNRVVKALAVDPEGVGTLVTRFLAPTPLPPVLAAQAAQVQTSGAEDATDQLLLAAARWVAHVPFLDDASLGKKRSNIWACNADFVALAAGDHEEHAHLLAGFFMELGQEAYVVLGTSTMGAQAACVLTTGRPLLAPEEVGSALGLQDTGSQWNAVAVPAKAAGAGAAESSSAADASAAATGDGPAAAGSSSTDPQQGQLQLRQRLQQAAAAAQARQQQAAAAAQASTVNPAAAMAAAAAMAQRPFNVSKLRMWNPLSGQCAPVRDPACEMREVGIVYSRDNIWANIQLSGHPWDISWNLGDSSCWRPFFGAVLQPREMASIQVPPVYQDLEQRCYEELEARVEETVRDALYEARSVVVTQPNNKLSRVLKALLKEVPVQMNAINSASLAASMAMSDNLAAVAGQGAADVAQQRLQQRLQLIQSLQVSHNDRVGREMRGCLINGHIIALPFSDSYADAVAEAVINTGLHRTVDPRVKFAMAAYVEPLGAAWVCCLWVYIAAIRETS